MAREVEVSLPVELDESHRFSLARTFAQRLADRYSIAVDLVVHAPHRGDDSRNHHAHLMMTTRKIVSDGLGDKSDIELSGQSLRSQGKPSERVQLIRIREEWATLTNTHLARAGYEDRVDHRWHRAHGRATAPTMPVFIHASLPQAART